MRRGSYIGLANRKELDMRAAMRRHDTTLPVTIDDIILHCRAAARGARRPFLLADLPFGTYESSSYDAVQSAVRILKEGELNLQ